MTGFGGLGVSSWLIDACESLSILSPTEIQKQSIPVLLSGKNAVVSSPTGSGKTLCFALPTLQRLSADPYGIFCLVLTPVRELAAQIQEQFAAIGQAIGVTTCLVVGGKGNVCQRTALSRRPHVVIATPGRLADTLATADDISAAFSRLQFLVLDEADRLLGSQGFQNDICFITKVLPTRQNRQTILVTATVDASVETLRQKYGVDEMPLITDAGNDGGNYTVKIVSSLQHKFVLMASVVRLTYLCHLLAEIYPNESVIIFTRTIMSCQVVASVIERLLKSKDPENRNQRSTVSCLHSLLEGQSRRFAALGKFRNGMSRILVATDVAARGLDIPSVGVVINYELPTDITNYVHRVGRAARAGRKGVAVSLVSENDVDLVHAVEDEYKITMDKLECNEDDVLKLMSATSKARREVEVMLHDIGFDERIEERRKRRRMK